jgi:hypothetical protein
MAVANSLCFASFLCASVSSAVEIFHITAYRAFEHFDFEVETSRNALTAL